MIGRAGHGSSSRRRRRRIVVVVVYVFLRIDVDRRRRYNVDCGDFTTLLGEFGMDDDSRLTNDGKHTYYTIRQIRRMREDGNWGLSKMAKRFGMSPYTIRKIGERAIYLEVPEEPRVKPGLRTGAWE